MVEMTPSHNLDLVFCYFEELRKATKDIYGLDSQVSFLDFDTIKSAPLPSPDTVVSALTFSIASPQTGLSDFFVGLNLESSFLQPDKDFLSIGSSFEAVPVEDRFLHSFDFYHKDSQHKFLSTDANSLIFSALDFSFDQTTKALSSLSPEALREARLLYMKNLMQDIFSRTQNSLNLVCGRNNSDLLNFFSLSNSQGFEELGSFPLSSVVKCAAVLNFKEKHNLSHDETFVFKKSSSLLSDFGSEIVNRSLFDVQVLDLKKISQIFSDAFKSLPYFDEKSILFLERSSAFDKVISEVLVDFVSSESKGRLDFFNGVPQERVSSFLNAASDFQVEMPSDLKKNFAKSVVDYVSQKEKPPLVSHLFQDIALKMIDSDPEFSKLVSDVFLTSFPKQEHQPNVVLTSVKSALRYDPLEDPKYIQKQFDCFFGKDKPDQTFRSLLKEGRSMNWNYSSDLDIFAKSPKENVKFSITLIEMEKEYSEKTGSDFGKYIAKSFLKEVCRDSSGSSLRRPVLFGSTPCLNFNLQDSLNSFVEKKSRDLGLSVHKKETDSKVSF